MNRYTRQISLEEIGTEGQKKLAQASVLVVGAGGLGCTVIQYLAAAGVGKIGIVDDDVVEISNLQRQTLYRTKDLGKSKAKKAKKFVEKLNPEIVVKSFCKKLSEKNTNKIAKEYELILDCTDNQESRYLINDWAVKNNKPFVYASLYKFKGQLSVFNYQNGPSYRCLYPKPKKEENNCNQLGVLGVLPGILGSMQANEALKIILEIGEVFGGKLLFFDGLINQIDEFLIERNETEIEKVRAKNHLGLEPKEAKTINFDDFAEYKNWQIVDVRQKGEKPKTNGKNLIQIPLEELEENLEKIDNSKNKLLICNTGARSQLAIDILDNFGIPNLQNLKGGLNGLKNKQKNGKS